jgi:hypothetical protein
LIAHPKSQPDVAADLFAMYSLQSLAAEVARIKPNGEKNALRKTYKGHMKDLAIAGKFDAVKHEPDTPGGLLEMVQMPDEIWNSQNTQAQSIRNGFSTMAQSRFKKALTMAKGLIPKSEWDSSVLGLDQPAPAQAAAAKSSSGGTPRYSGPIAQRPSKVENTRRPSRNVKKRSYTDDTFAGYGEGYVDDNMVDDAGYSTGDGDRDDRGAHKRRKKVGLSMKADHTRLTIIRTRRMPFRAIRDKLAVMVLAWWELECR